MPRFCLGGSGVRRSMFLSQSLNQEKTCDPSANDLHTHLVYAEDLSFAPSGIMRFGKTLHDSVYEPWKPYYIDYAKLKGLLREDDAGENLSNNSTGRKWTAADEGAFTEELVNVQLEKVNNFHKETIKHLQDKCTECEAKLEGYRRAEQSPKEKSAGKAEELSGSDTLAAVLEELDSITEEVNELEKYSRLNYAGFLKAAKKHDRLRGSNYKVRPLLQVRLAALPFNSEDYAPLLYR